MHDFTMPQWAIDRVMQRRGKLHVHDDMDPRRTALIVVDLQNGFMVPAYTPMPVQTAIGTVPNVNRLAATLRETGRQRCSGSRTRPTRRASRNGPTGSP